MQQLEPKRKSLTQLLIGLCHGILRFHVSSTTAPPDVYDHICQELYEFSVKDGTSSEYSISFSFESGLTFFTSVDGLAYVSSGEIEIEPEGPGSSVFFRLNMRSTVLQILVMSALVAYFTPLSGTPWEGAIVFVCAYMILTALVVVRFISMARHRPRQH